MIVVLRRGTTAEQQAALVQELESYGLGVRSLQGGGKPLLHIVSGSTRRTRRVLRAERVEALVPTSGPRLRRDGHRIFPYHFLRWCAAGIVIFGVMVLLAGAFPPGTGDPVRVDSPPANLDWPWYLRAPRAVLLAFPPEQRWVGVGLLLGLIAVLFLLPWLDRTRGVGLRARWPFAAATLLLLLGAIVMSFTGGVS